MGYAVRFDYREKRAAWLAGGWGALKGKFVWRDANFQKAAANRKNRGNPTHPILLPVLFCFTGARNIHT